ncbi:penicillin-binding protein 1A [Thermoanaerobacter kivui]|uniref:Penicillin-binding protein 1A n=1 Tax=Thermoanaerobacter kivui TaxID=2325 RepID=A0A097ANS9_THEKI|nr:penicillin-binding protein 1A [Thermoanaerobacter kivui]AIS51466.1 penicillin-binding protein 1A [Thermoanaerobacter kivui]
MENKANLKRSERRKHKEKSKNKSTVRSILKFIIYAVIILIFAGIGAIGGKVLAIIKNTPPISQEALTSQNQSSIVYANDSNGQWKRVAILHGADNRLWVPIEKIPKDLQNAFVAIEDQRFYRNNLGIDPKRIIGALIADIKAGGKPVQGASTITQQLVKNTMLSSEKTLSRKIQEAVLAWRLEQKYSKQQILEAYLNTIYLGGPNVNAYGVQAAALAYFGKDVSQLNLAECAMIAGITNNPSLYSPYANLEAATERQHLVLKEMLEQGYITKEQYDKAIAEKLVFKKTNFTTYDHKYFIDQVINDVADALSKKLNISHDEAINKIYNGGLRIYSTMDLRIQSYIEEAFKNPKLFPVNSKIKDEAQGAMVVMDWKTGEVKGLVGGRDTSNIVRGFNRATQAYRQPGSSIKPLTVYAPALESGLTAATVVDDVPTTFGNWTPHNYESSTYRGLVTLREALTHSLNIPAVKVVDRIGIATSANYGKKFGLDITKNDMYLPALALGGLYKGVTPLQEAAAYGAIANGGVYTTPITFTKITDSEGNLILENKPLRHVVLSEQNAYILTSIMEDVVKYGTGTRARLPNMPVAGKTGTTDNYSNAWFTGFTPYYVATVWMGYDNNSMTLRDDRRGVVVGGSFPAEMWKTVMLQIHKDLPYKDFVRPPGIISVTVCKDSGELPTDLCHLDPRGDRTYAEIFAQGTQPTTYCTVHVTAKINFQNGKLATALTPPELVKDAVFIDPPGRTPAQNAVARDGKYVVPTQYDDTTSILPGNNESNNDSAPTDNGQQPPSDNNNNTQPPGGESPNPPLNNDNTQTNPDNTQNTNSNILQKLFPRKGNNRP